MIIIACLVIAFAQPVVPSGKSGSTSPSAVIGVYIDNSQSMEFTGQGESLLSQAKARASEIVTEFPPDTRFLLLSNGSSKDFSGYTDKQLTIKAINEIRQSSEQMDMDDILLYFSQNVDGRTSAVSTIIIVSDFQESVFTKPIRPYSGPAVIYPLAIQPVATANVSIDTCWLENPLTLAGQGNQIIARINNRSDQDYENFPVRLILNDTLRNETSVRLTAGATTEVSLGFRASSNGWQSGSVQISDFPVLFDNDLLFSFTIESDIPVLLLHGKEENPFLKGIYGNDPYFKFESYIETGFPGSDFSKYSLVILSGIPDITPRLAGRIRTYVQEGGTVWFLPELQGNIYGYNEFLKSISAPEFQGTVPARIESGMGPGQSDWLSEVVVNLDKRLRLPYFNQTLRMIGSPGDRTDILLSASGDLLISRIRHGAGSSIVSAFPLDNLVTDLMYHPLFVPLCYRFATMSARSQPLYQINGLSRPVALRTGGGDGDPVRIVENKSGFETIPVQRTGNGNETILFPDNISTQGIYSAISGSDTIGMLAFNASRAESALKYLPDTVVAKRLGTAGWNIMMNNNSDLYKNPKGFADRIASRKLWHYFLILAFVGLLAESFAMQSKK
jgi:hypothetical protein